LRQQGREVKELTLDMDELQKKDVGQDSRFYAMGVSCGQAIATHANGEKVATCSR
jgi:uncharacterized protein YoaH (UPF0181 family)